jgi:hypothetical protein
VECRATARIILAFLEGNAKQVTEGLASVTFQLGTSLSLSSFYLVCSSLFFCNPFNWQALLEGNVE